MRGAILSKSDGIINIIATGDYDDLQSRLEYYCKICGDTEIKLVNTSGIDIDEVIRNQESINETFSSEFD